MTIGDGIAVAGGCVSICAFVGWFCWLAYKAGEVK